MDWISYAGMAGEWFNRLDVGAQQILINAAGDVVAAPAVAIFGVVGRGIAALLPKEKRGQAEQQAIQAAIQAALGDALLDTLMPLAQNPEELRHYTKDLFGPWLKKPAVISELAKVIAPRAEAGGVDTAGAPDLALLEAVFTKELHFTATADALGAPFAAIVADLLENFSVQAAWQPALRPAVQVRAARTTNVLLKRLAPLDLDVLIQDHYLRKVSEESNLLPLVKGDPRDRKPRLQQVFVDLRVADEPTESQFLLRLGLPRWRQTLVLKALHATWVKRAEATSSMRMAASQGDKPATWLDKLAALDQSAIAELAQEIHVDAQALAGAHHKMTPLEKLATLPKPQMVLLGVPGSGKSTLTRRVAAILAILAGSEESAPLDLFTTAWVDQMLAAFQRRLLPVRVVMSQWAQHAPAADGCAADLIRECARLISRLCGAGAERLHEEVANRIMANPPTVFVLLDGLDEVTDEERRRVLLQSVRDFCQVYPDVPLLITCRERPWAALQAEMTRGDLPSIDLPATTLQSLTSDAIDLFITRWHAEMEQAGFYDDASKSARCRMQLQAALRNPQRKDLREMARTPLLLTMMVLVNYRRELPDSRVELYEELVKQLLFEWERTKLEDERKKSGLELLLPKENDQADFQAQLNQLAFDIHDPAHSNDTVDIPAQRLLWALKCAYTNDPDDPSISAAAQTWATQVLALITTRSGLINEVNIGQELTPQVVSEVVPLRAGRRHANNKESVYQFAHRTFQEYLAARWMAAADDSFDLIAQRIDQPEWREAILLAIGYQCTYIAKGHDQTIYMLNELWPDRVAQPAGWPRILLLGEAFVHLFGADGRRKVKERKLAQKLEALALEDLKAVMQNRALPVQDCALPVQDRLQAALLLDDLRNQLNLAPLGLDDFIAVPDTKLHVGKYPVTNRQFKRFVDAGGYGDAHRLKPAWWSEQGWGYRCQFKWAAPRYLDDNRYNRPAQPFVGVSWYEAEAYCNWLNDAASVAHLPGGTRYLPENTDAHLPTQEQWMLAARNGKTAERTNDKNYPWADRFDKALANTKESDFGQTTPVDMYPDGATPAGVCDLAGNVWEWTLDKNKDDWYYLKGGSWADAGDRAKASAAAFRAPRVQQARQPRLPGGVRPHLSWLVLIAGCCFSDF